MKPVAVKTILNKTKRQDPWFLDTYTVNPFSGCSFNCLFCYIRGSKYGTHMERKATYKANAVELLRKQLATRAKKSQYGYIVLASATEPYPAMEQELKLTRALLEVILEFRFPVHILTRSDLVERDLDLLMRIDRTAILPPDLANNPGRGVFLTFSFSSVDPQITRIFEPGATAPQPRLTALKKTAEAGLLTGVSMMPHLPFITDTSDQLERSFAAFADHGAHYVFPATLTLFGEEPSSSKMLVYKAVEKHYPHLLERYHRYFDGQTELPIHYRKAFQKKSAALAAQHGLRTKIPV